MKNYYEILEVNENASLEVIEKAYRTLAKKYHPDGWPNDKKYWAEDRFKEITEAYQVLSDDFMRREYDIKIGINDNIDYKYDKLYKENEKLKQEINSIKVKKISKKTDNSNEEKTQKISPATYFNRYSSTLKSIINDEVNKPQEERSRDLKALIITIIIISILIFVVLKVPFLHNYIFP